MRFAIIAFSLFLLSSCAMEYESYQQYLSTKRLPPPRAESFPHCRGYGCPDPVMVELDAREWAWIDAGFTPLPRTAAEERKRIEPVIGMFEQIVGGLAGTDRDVGDTFKKTGQGQLDCVDESTNTTIYLDLLRQRGFLRFHTIDQPQVRYPFTGGGYWWHQTAVIKDIETGEAYAVDSWFHDNGHPAHVVPLEDWKTGWKP